MLNKNPRKGSYEHTDIATNTPNKKHITNISKPISRQFTLPDCFT